MTATDTRCGDILVVPDQIFAGSTWGVDAKFLEVSDAAVGTYFRASKRGTVQGFDQRQVVFRLTALQHDRVFFRRRTVCRGVVGAWGPFRAELTSKFMAWAVDQGPARFVAAGRVSPILAYMNHPEVKALCARLAAHDRDEAEMQWVA